MKYRVHYRVRSSDSTLTMDVDAGSESEAVEEVRSTAVDVMGERRFVVVTVEDLTPKATKKKRSSSKSKGAVSGGTRRGMIQPKR